MSLCRNTCNVSPWTDAHTDDRLLIVLRDSKQIVLLIAGILGVAILIAFLTGSFTLSDDLSQPANQIALTDLQDQSPTEVGENDVDSAQVASVLSTPTPSRPTPTPVRHSVADGETLLEIAGNYGIRVESLARANGLWDPNHLQIGQVLTIPVPGLYFQASARTPGPGEILLAWPLEGEITTDFGEPEPYYIGGTHTGTDIAANVGAPVRAAANGQVIEVIKQSNNLGWHIVIAHSDGWSTLYGHLSEFMVDEGDTVERGQVIAGAGDTGFSLGPHLPFEVRHWGTLVDPMKYLP